MIIKSTAVVNMGILPAMEQIVASNCPGCGHSMTLHRGRHCSKCEEGGVECAALEPGVESPGG